LVSKIRIALVGVGNCASSLVQGIHYYGIRREEGAIGLMHWRIGGYTPGDIEVVAAIDIDERKVGRDLAEAIFALPNCTRFFYPKPASGFSWDASATGFPAICDITRRTKPSSPPGNPRRRRKRWSLP